MSHNINYYTYPQNVNKKKVQTDLDNYVAHVDWQEGCSGLAKPIRWLDGKVYQNEEEARSAIDKLDSGWYDQLAVLFKESRSPADKKVNELTLKREAAYTEYNRRYRVLYSDTITAEYIGCKACGSRLARKYLKSNNCPVCRAEMRPEHMLKSVQAAKNKWERADKEVKDYVDKHGKKDVMWLVKIEYHT